MNTLLFSLPEWLSCGVGGVFLVFGLVLAGCNWYILFFNILHHWIRKDGKYSSYLSLVPAAFICIGGILLSPWQDNLEWLCMLDISLLNLLVLPVYAVWKGMVYLCHVICRPEK